MSQTTTSKAVADLSAALRSIVPDAPLNDLDENAQLREELELDSLDFLAFVEQLSRRSGVRIDEEDYPQLRTFASCVRFLHSRPASRSSQ